MIIIVRSRDTNDRCQLYAWRTTIWSPPLSIVLGSSRLPTSPRLESYPSRIIWVFEKMRVRKTVLALKTIWSSWFHWSENLLGESARWLNSICETNVDILRVWHYVWYRAFWRGAPVPNEGLLSDLKIGIWVRLVNVRTENIHYIILLKFELCWVKFG